MKTPDPAYRIYVENSILQLEHKIRALNTTILDPKTAPDIVIKTALQLNAVETILRAQRTKLANPMKAA